VSDIELKEVDDIRLDFNNVLLEKEEEDRKATPTDERRSGSSDESSEEQSIEYRDGKVFDEVKRAQYGIISVKK